MNILEELYCGNIGFDSRVYPKDSSFIKAAHIKMENREKLEAKLNDTEKKLFNNYCEAESEIDDITRYDTYCEVLKFGILLMIEIFTGTGERTDTVEYEYENVEDEDTE